MKTAKKKTTKKPARAKAVLKVKPVEVSYAINGKALRAIIEKVGIRQVDLAEACGHADGTRISHMLRKGDQKVRDTTLRPIVAVLVKHGVRVDGLVDV